MGDIFHFSSPRKPSAVARHRHSLRKKSKVTRLRRTENMFTHRACVAQYQEPTFCPNEASDPFIPGAFLHSVTVTSRDTLSPFHSSYYTTNDINDDDDDDDEIGGVQLPQTQHDEDATMTDAFDDVHIADTSTFIPNDTYPKGTPTDEISNYDNFTSSLPTIAQSATWRRRSHPRPLTTDILQGEDGRRTRLALEAEPVDGLPHFVRSPGPAADVSTPTSHALPEANVIPHHRTASDRNATYDSPHPPPHQPTAAEIEAAQVVFAHEARLDEMDEDAIAVDDPRRSYDVADFMDTWRLHSICDKRLPSFEPGLQSSLRVGQKPDLITRANVNTGSVDMQGIRWQLVGPSRRQATIARAMLHPSGLGTSYFPSKQPPTSTSTTGDDERQYRFRATISQHKAKFSHYQLRNVLAASSRNEIFYATGNQVARASLACPTLSETTMDLSKPGNSASSFRVTCLSASNRQSFSDYRTDNVLIAGGFCGEYAILGLDVDQPHSEGFVTHAYNGLVTHIHNYQDRRSGGLRAAFCSNDRKVRLMDLNSLSCTDEFCYDNPINCSATSPDGRLRVLVGDTIETLITDAERGGIIVNLEEHNEHGFACAWSQDGRHVATAAQDGNVLVWDARNWSKPLRSLDSVMSCARSLNFTDKGTLVVAENDDVVRFYDSSNFDSWQELRFFGSIAGVALLNGGEELAIANADKTIGGLMTFERSSQGMGGGSYRRRVANAGLRGPACRRGRPQGEVEHVTELLI